ncbi:MAG: preprotein translocase subunit SecG [bacterium]|nr:preprotein translocase subunit SecG [bacterium]
MDLSLLAHTTLAQSTPTLAMSWSPVVTNILVGVFLIVSIAMILLVLIQRPQGGGLSGAFGAGGGGGGGGGAGQTAFGTKTGDVLTGATITIFVLFLITAIVLNFATRPADPRDNVPTLTTPAGETDPDDSEAVESTPSETTPIDDAEQAIEDVMDSETSVEGDVEEGTDEPATSQEPPAGSEPGTDEPTADED